MGVIATVTRQKDLVLEAGPGDFFFVPRGAIHRESNPSGVEAEIIVTRSGTGEPVVNVDGPEPG